MNKNWMFEKAIKIAKHFKIKAKVKNNKLILEQDERIYTITKNSEKSKAWKGEISIMWIVDYVDWFRTIHPDFWTALTAAINKFREQEVSKYMHKD